MTIKEMLGGPGGIAIASAVGIVGLAGYFMLLAPSEAPVPDPVAPEDTAFSPTSSAGNDTASPAEPDNADATAAQDSAGSGAAGKEPVKADAEPEAIAVDPPRFSDLRLDANGLAVVAGTAPAGFEVTLKEADATLATAMANRSGDFAMVFNLEPTAEARILHLVAVSADGTEYRSEETAILTPPMASPETDLVAETPVTENGETGDASPPTEAEAGAREIARSPGSLKDSGPAIPSPQAAETAPVSEPDAIDMAAVGGEQSDASGPMAEPAQRAAENVPAPVAEPTGELIAAQPGPGVAEDLPGNAVTGAVEAANTSAPAESPAIPSGQSDATPATPVGDDASPASPGGTPTVLLAGRDGIELLQPAASPAEPLRDRVMIDVISYSEDGSVSLSGRAAASMPRADRVRVYLDNRPLQTAKLAPDGSWTMRLPSVAPGIYTLRVDQIDGDDAVVARFETPFKREDPGELARVAPVDLAPEGVAASLITVQPGYTLWGIATDRYGSGLDYVQIFEANRNQIRDPDLIYPGQIFELPEDPESE